MPPQDQILMGTAIAAVCLAGAWQSVWLVEETRKGQRLGDWLGPAKAAQVLRIVLICGALAGGLLAVGILNPVRW
jgi:hypothetical protein